MRANSVFLHRRIESYRRTRFNQNDRFSRFAPRTPTRHRPRYGHGCGDAPPMISRRRQRTVSLPKTTVSLGTR